MAYVLGFWFADGYMRKEKSYRITISGNDKEILIKIKDVMSSGHPIRFTDKKKEVCHFVSFCSKKLFNDLTNLGGFRKKSTTITFPYVPKKLLPDFIRGYFDGDGSVFFVNYIRTKDKRPTKELRSNFTSGSIDFLKSLMFILNKEIGLPIKQIGVYNDTRSLKLGYGTRDSDTLLHYMYYPGFPIGMDRKSVFLSRIPKYQKHSFAV